MPLQAVIGPQTLKAFTKCLTCLSRYGDEVVLQANSEGLILATTNSSKSAFSRVKFTTRYFATYSISVTTPPGSTFKTPPDEPMKITGQLMVKALISILKHKTVENSVNRCEMLITEGGDDLEDFPVDAEEADSLESKMIVRLHCKHGVVKTHRLVLLTTTSLVAPVIVSSPTESRVTVGPRTLRDILGHFPHTKGTKSDPQLVWLFEASRVKVKSIQMTSDAKGGKSQISTEISIAADEFDSYDVNPPVSVGFHLREFNATISLAESLSVALALRFTEPTKPIYIEFETDSVDTEFLFVISTTDSAYDGTSQKQNGQGNLRKRDRDEEPNEDTGTEAGGSSRNTKKRPQRAAVLTNSSEASQAMPNQSIGQLSISQTASMRGVSQRSVAQNAEVQQVTQDQQEAESSSRGAEPKGSLFLPGASQLSNVDIDILRESGLGIEHMDYDEFEAMMEAEGEEVGMSTKIVGERLEGRGAWQDDESLTPMSQEEAQFPPTQAPVGDRNFQPLFDD